MMKEISFQIRVIDNATLEEICTRVGKALNCTFVPSEHKLFAGDEALETEILGLWITINYFPTKDEGKIRNYRLTGEIAERLQYPEANVIDVSEYMLGILTRIDAAAWYIPDLNEKLSESSLTLE